MTEQNHPVYAEITGPIVMIGFGSIGRGTLPLIERHFKFDKSRMVVIDPREEPADMEILEEARRPSHQGVCDQGQLQGPAEAAADRRRRPGLLRQPFGRYRLARPDEALPQARRALYRHGRRALARLLFRQEHEECRPHQLCAARNRAQGEGEEPGRRDRRFHLRRKSWHGFLVRQAGARQPRQRHRPQVRTSRISTIAKAGRS